MGVFHIFKIVHMVLNRATHHKYSAQQRKIRSSIFSDVLKLSSKQTKLHKGMRVYQILYVHVRACVYVLAVVTILIMNTPGWIFLRHQTRHTLRSQVRALRIAHSVRSWAWLRNVRRVWWREENHREIIQIYLCIYSLDYLFIQLVVYL